MDLTRDFKEFMSISEGTPEDVSTPEDHPRFWKPMKVTDVPTDVFQIKYVLIRNWKLPFWFSGAYVILVFGILLWRRNRPAFQLRPLLVLWNIFLAFFSTLGAWYTVQEVIYSITNHGWEFSVCDSRFTFDSPAELWVILFVFSKPVELIDTLFIVLRKQKLTFLHFYHHLSAMMMAWWAFNSSARWLIALNYSVHSLMYSYYTLRTMKIRLPKLIPMIITSLQIIQMIAALVVNYVGYKVLKRKDVCDMTYDNIKVVAGIYFSYLILFCHFFYKRYISAKNSPVKKSN